MFQIWKQWWFQMFFRITCTQYKKSDLLSTCITSCKYFPSFNNLICCTKSIAAISTHLAQRIAHSIIATQSHQPLLMPMQCDNLLVDILFPLGKSTTKYGGTVSTLYLCLISIFLVFLDAFLLVFIHKLLAFIHINKLLARSSYVNKWRFKLHQRIDIIVHWILLPFEAELFQKKPMFLLCFFYMLCYFHFPLSLKFVV
jgi:hypothetical protein